MNINFIFLILLREFFNRKTEIKRECRKYVWVKPWLPDKAYEMAYRRRFTELRSHDQQEFRRYLRMNTRSFQVFFLNCLLYFNTISIYLFTSKCHLI